MIYSWWWIWLVFMFVLLLSSTGYGWGYRRWGPPYPRYIQRRRGERAARDGGNVMFNHHAWGWGGDIFWIFMIIWIVWICAILWRR